MAVEFIKEVNILKLAIKCICNLPDIALARNYYGAKVVSNADY